MEILNPEENSNFVDHYLDIKVDFSEVIFILTANNILNMLEPLKNRLEIIEIPPYIQQEKLSIARKYLVPKLNESYKFKEDSIKFTNEDLLQIINGYFVCFIY
jgi:ATP-dependent Lon protease